MTSTQRADASPARAYALRICAHCAQNFEPKTTWQKFCATPCRIAAHEAQRGKTLYFKRKK